jgi:hypothetical protein
MVVVENPSHKMEAVRGRTGVTSSWRMLKEWRFGGS